MAECIHQKWEQQNIKPSEWRCTNKQVESSLSSRAQTRWWPCEEGGKTITFVCNKNMINCKLTQRVGSVWLLNVEPSSQARPGWCWGVEGSLRGGTRWRQQQKVNQIKIHSLRYSHLLARFLALCCTSTREGEIPSGHRMAGPLQQFNGHHHGSGTGGKMYGADDVKCTEEDGAKECMV